MQNSNIVCLACFRPVQSKHRSTFLGFRKFDCPHCEATVVYDLRSGYRVLYWALTLLIVVGMIRIIASGDVPIPGLLGVAIVWALIGDARKRQEIKRALGRASATG